MTIFVFNKELTSVESFKSRLQSFKSESISNGDSCNLKFRELSGIQLSKINDNNQYVGLKLAYLECFKMRKVSVRHVNYS